MTGLVVQSKSLSKTVFMSLRHAQYTAKLQHSQQSTLNTTVTPVVFTAQCCCKILSNEHANWPSTCFDEEVTKQYRTRKRMLNVHRWHRKSNVLLLSRHQKCWSLTGWNRVTWPAL